MVDPEMFAPSGGNWVLRGLPVDDLERLAVHLEPVRAEPRQVLYDAGQPIPHVYFPLTAVFSVLAVAPPDRAIEVATVGREGLAGVPVFLGAADTPGRAICQVPGWAFRISSHAFREELGRNVALHRATERYVRGLFEQMAQCAACNNAHTLEQRCARWLLVVHDRVGADTFGLTQESLARMLGVQRASVNSAAGKLQDAGLVDYRRGRMTIRDRAGLENACCGCYLVIQRAFVRPTD